jgi:hypothetical protein
MAKGGGLPAAQNQAILKESPEQIFLSADRGGAIRWLEATLSLGEDQEAQETSKLSGLLFRYSDGRLAPFCR